MDMSLTREDSHEKSLEQDSQGSVAIPNAGELYVTSVLPKARDWMDRAGVTVEAINTVLVDPTNYALTTAENGCWAVFTDEWKLILAPNCALLLSFFVRPDDCGMYEQAPPAGKKQPAGRSGAQKQRKQRANGAGDTRLRDTPTDLAAYLDLLHEFGFDCLLGSKSAHYKITHPKKPGKQMTMSSTPSDRRWINNSISQIRYVFEIDVRRDDPAKWAA